MAVTIKRVNQFLLFGILSAVVLYYGRQLLSPVVLAALLALLMAPLCRKLDAFRLPRAISAFLCVFLLLNVLLGLLAIATAQMVNISKDIPQAEKKVAVMVDRVQSMVQEKFNVSEREQSAFVKKQIKALGQSAGNYMGAIVAGISGTFGTIILSLVFTFLFLFNKENLGLFFVRLYKEESRQRVNKVLEQVAGVSQSYLTGRAISMCIQATAFSIGLLIIGIKNAVLLGCIAGTLSILPFVGPLLGGLFPILVSFVTEENPTTTLWVIGLLVVIQILDNYLVEPNVVGGKINLNAFATIFIILVGGSIWGVLGMILFTPLLGMFRILCDHVEELEPYTYLVGDSKGGLKG